MRAFNYHDFAKMLVLTVFAAFACFLAVKPTPTMASSSTVESSQASIYRAHCARCHGNDGRSNTVEGRRTEASDLTDDSVKNMAADKMARIIRNGKGDMPAFGKKLSAAQITALVRYVRSL